MRCKLSKRRVGVPLHLCLVSFVIAAVVVLELFGWRVMRLDSLSLGKHLWRQSKTWRRPDSWNLQDANSGAPGPSSQPHSSIEKSSGSGNSSIRSQGMLQGTDVGQRLHEPLDGITMGLSNSIPGDGSEFIMQDPAIILFCYNRSHYLDRTFSSLVDLPQLGKFALYISEDGDDKAVTNLVRSWHGRFRRKARSFEHWQRRRVPIKGHPNDQPGHAWLTQHYKWGLERVFDATHGHSHVIIVEDDMLFSPDFLLLFQATAVLLERDPSLWCISSWNSNSHADGFDWKRDKLLRTSYFPGLGWMMRAQLWREIAASWPSEAWDHWMRMYFETHGRECIAPEVNRNRNIGEVGVNVNKHFFKTHLSQMTWQRESVRDFGDLSYLTAARYEEGIRTLLRRSVLRPTTMVALDSPTGGVHTSSERLNTGRVTGAAGAAQALEAPSGHVYLVLYRQEDYAILAKHLHIWTVPRGHFRHVAMLPYRGSIFLLANARACPLLPEGARIRSSVGLVPVPARVNQDCTTACSNVGKICNGDDFWFINTCSMLSASFLCERGCSIEQGDDIPCYVNDTRMATHRQCLVTERTARCGAKHRSTARLCPCISLPAGNTHVGSSA